MYIIYFVEEEYGNLNIITWDAMSLQGSIRALTFGMFHAADLSSLVEVSNVSCFLIYLFLFTKFDFVLGKSNHYFCSRLS